MRCTGKFWRKILEYTSKKKKKCLILTLSFLTITVLVRALLFWHVQSFLAGKYIYRVNYNDKSIRYLANDDELSDSECPSAVIFARVMMTRFGNHFIEYCATWTTAMKYNYTPVVANLIYKELNASFEGLSVPSEQTFLSGVDINCRKRLKHAFSKQPATKGMDDLLEKLPARQPIALRATILLVEMVSPRVAEIRKEFRFRQEYVNYVKEKFHSIRNNLGYPIEADKEVTYIGIHPRRADYLSYLHHGFGIKVEQQAGVDYFRRALEFMWKKVNGIGKWNVVFVVASDDMKWCNDKLIPELRKYVETNDLSKNVSVVWGGSKNSRNDFAVLSSCNHSIISYGTYGVSSAILAGGWTVAYDVTFGGQIEKKKLPGSVHFARNIPGWTLLY